MPPIIIPPASEDYQEFPERDETSLSSGSSGRSSSSSSSESSYGDDEAPLHPEKKQNHDEEQTEADWAQDWDEPHKAASAEAPRSSSWRSRLGWIKSPVVLIGAATAFLVFAIVIGVRPWNHNTSSKSAPASDNGLGSNTPPTVVLFETMAPTMAQVSRDDNTTATTATTATPPAPTPSTTTEQPPVSTNTTEEPPAAQDPTTPQVDVTTTEQPPTEQDPTTEQPEPVVGPPLNTTGSFALATKITYDNGIDESFFGKQVAVEDGTMIVSALNDDLGGGAYVFVRPEGSVSEWLIQGILAPTIDDDAAELLPNDAYGECVDISGDTAIVGAPRQANDEGTSNAGGVYVFTRDDQGVWTQQAKLQAVDGAENDRFGFACAIYQDTIVVGAPYDDVGDTPNIGMAYVFVRNAESGEWSEQAKLTPDMENSACRDSVDRYRLGTVVAVTGDMIALSPNPGSECRRVHMFTRGGDGSWSQTQEVGEDGPCTYSVSMTNRRMALGDPCAAVNGVLDAGSVTMMEFTDDQWTSTGIITVESPGTEDSFGVDVAVNGRFVLIGMSRENSEAGGAFLYRQQEGNWELQASMEAGERAGSSVALHNDIAVVGSSRDDDLGQDKGGVYIFAPIDQLETPVEPPTEEPPQDDPATEDADASLWVQQAQLGPGINATQFANAVDIDGETLIASAVDSNFGFSYIFSRNNDKWSLISNLAPSDTTEGTGFGSCVAISGDWAVVGAPYQNGNVGVVYAFTKDGDSWKLHSTLEAGEEEPKNDRYGLACDISGNKIVVGAPFADTEAYGNLGAAYIYILADDEWTLESKVYPADDSACASEFDKYKFGSVVSMDRNTVVVAADTQAGGCRRAHIFFRDRDGVWSQDAEVGEDGDCPYSLSVSQKGRGIALGDRCYSDSDELSQIGRASVYAYVDNAWGLQTQIASPEGMQGGLFGSTISLDGSYLLIGMLQEGPTSSAWLFSFNDGGEWLAQEALLGGSGGSSATALSGSTALIASSEDSAYGELAGSITVFVIGEETSPDDGNDEPEVPEPEEPEPEEPEPEEPEPEEPEPEEPQAEEPGPDEADTSSPQEIGLEQPNFASIVDVDGDTIITSSTDGAHVFTKTDSWKLLVDLEPADTSEGTGFGSCVAISGDWAVVGAPYQNGNVGVVYAFTKDGDSWKLHSTLEAGEEEPKNDRYGLACDISGNKIVVGAPFADTEAYGNLGAAYIYILADDEWTLESKVYPADDSACASEFDKYKFGSVVSMDRNTVVVAADTQAGGCRRAHIFFRDRDGVWSQDAEVGEDGDCPYSLSVSQKGRGIALGDRCYSDSDELSQIGRASVYAYVDNAWVQQGSDMLARRAQAGDAFGSSIALDDTSLLIGLGRSSDEDGQAGGAWLYSLNADGNWARSEYYEADQVSVVSVALSDGTIVLGSPQGEMGSAFIFALELDQPPEDSPDLEPEPEPEEPQPEEPQPEEPQPEEPQPEEPQPEEPQPEEPQPEEPQPEEPQPEEPQPKEPQPEEPQPEEPQPEEPQPEEPQPESGWVEFPKLTHAPDAPGSAFGSSFDIDDTTMIASSTDGAHLFTKTGDGIWEFLADLEPADTSEGTGFGSCVAISGDWAVVGAPYQNGNVGVVYAFTKDGDSWKLHSTLEAGEEEPKNDRYGLACDISGNKIVVGAPFADTEAYGNLGAAYIYILADDEWTLESKVYPADDSACASEFDKYKFGSVVSMDRNTVVVAADTQAGGCRRAHIFFRDRDGVWSQDAEVGEDGDCPYSLSVSQKGRGIALGDRCYSDSDELSQIGRASVYAYVDNAWVQQGSDMLARRAQAGDAFGSSVSLDGDSLLVGLVRSGQESEPGGAWLYSLNEEGNWARSLSFDAAEDSGFAIALNGNSLAIGAPADEAGSIRIFEFFVTDEE